MARTPTDDIEQFQTAVNSGDTDPHPYDRLMIHYRKEKNYKDELRVINKALKIFNDQLKRQQSAMYKGVKSRSKIQQLSTNISKSVGINYLPEPLARWTKRKQTVEEKISRQSNKKK